MRAATVTRSGIAIVASFNASVVDSIATDDLSTGFTYLGANEIVLHQTGIAAPISSDSIGVVTFFGLRVERAITAIVVGRVVAPRRATTAWTF